MSLLNHGTQRVVVYPEVETTDSDGNPFFATVEEGIETLAVVQLKAQSGTSSRRSEQDNEGFETEETYRLRLPKGFPYLLGTRSQVWWNGSYWHVFGFPAFYTGSQRTSHIDYTIRRS